MVSIQKKAGFPRQVCTGMIRKQSLSYRYEPPEEADGGNPAVD